MNDTPSMGDLFGGETAGGWLNMPRGDINAPQGVDIAVLGIGSATPYPVGSYCHDAPDAIRAARSWPTILEQHDFDLFGVGPSDGVLPDGVIAADFGNLDTVADAAPEVTASNRAMIRGAVTGLLDSGSVPFVLAAMIRCRSRCLNPIVVLTMARSRSCKSTRILTGVMMLVARRRACRATCAALRKWRMWARSCSLARAASARPVRARSRPRWITALLSTPCAT